MFFQLSFDVIVIIIHHYMMLYNDVNYVNVADEIEVITTWEFKNCYFQ